jgi:FKBP-type peptidyl-prolyl cis-trans isomerase
LPAPAETAAAPAPSATASPGLVKDDVKVGTGPAAKTGDHVFVHYVGTLTDGTKFDSSRDRGEPFDFTLGGGQVIKGWDQGVVGMKKGGIRNLTIPSELGYGKNGSPPKIPPDATLKFEIELLEIK